MSTAVLVRKSFTFGSDEAIEAVLSRIADGVEEHPVWGTLNSSDARTVRRAVLGAELSAIKPRDLREGTFYLTREQSAQVFEVLCDYALAETTCDIDTDTHDVAPSAQGFCDCDGRSRAWSWASNIAETFGVEMI